MFNIGRHIVDKYEMWIDEIYKQASCAVDWFGCVIFTDRIDKVLVYVI